MDSVSRALAHSVGANMLRPFNIEEPSLPYEAWALEELFPGSKPSGVSPKTSERFRDFAPKRPIQLRQQVDQVRADYDRIRL